METEQNTNETIRVAICSVGEMYGGVERQILDLCSFLRRHSGVDPLVILFHDKELARQLRERGHFPKIVSGRNRYDVKMLGHLKTILKENRINVVHAHGYKATIGCGLVKNQIGFRLIKTEHGKREATIAQPIPWLKSWINFHLEQFITRRKVDFVAYVTRDIQNFFSGSHGGVPRGTVYNGIDPLNPGDYLRPEDLPEGGFTLGIVGRVTQVKGIPFALEALARPGVGSHVRLVVLGTGGMVDELKRLAVKLGVSDQVRFLGFRRNIFDYLSHIDALLIPSFHEGLPYTLLETMSLGKPIIASRVGGLKEVLQEGGTGSLVEVGDVVGLTEAIVQLDQSLEKRRRLGEGGRREQLLNFTLDQMGKKYLKIFLNKYSFQEDGTCGGIGD